MDRPLTPTKTLQVSYSSSGAFEAASRGHIVVIVDVIDMSTSAEAAIQAGAAAVFGASLDVSRPPVPIDPANIGHAAALAAKNESREVIVICEPRTGPVELRIKNVRKLLSGMAELSIKPSAILGNLGAEVQKLTDLKDKIVVIASDSGGVAYDTAFNVDPSAVAFATVARTIGTPGWENSQKTVARAIELARSRQKSLTFIAASHNSPEDVLAAHELAKLAITQGFLDLNNSGNK